MLNSWIGDCSDTCDAKKCLLFSQVDSLASILSLPAYFEGRLPGSAREGKVHLILAIFELNNVPRTPADSLSHPGVINVDFQALHKGQGYSVSHLAEFPCAKFCKMTRSLKPIVSFKYKPQEGARVFLPEQYGRIFFGR